MEVSSSVCRLHRDRRAAGAIGSCAYCAACLQEIAAALRGVLPGVVPRECAATALGSAGWRGLAGSGAAHWLAHERKLRPLPPLARCAAGFAVRRADLLVGRRELVRELPRPGDLWLDLDEEGCGVVVSSRRGEDTEVELSIRAPIGGSLLAAVHDFYRDLSGRGRFFR
ncbi:MAG: hypothetical protein WEF50_18370 [Myxococcota bacterium]